MEDTCLFAESLCYVLHRKPTSIHEFLQEWEVEACSITLGDLKPSFQCLPSPTAGGCPMIDLFTEKTPGTQPFTRLFTTRELNKYVALLKSADLFRLHVCRLADDAIRDQKPPLKYEQVREQVSDIAKQFDLNLWLADFHFWMLSLTQTSLEELQKCLADATASQTQPSLEELRTCLADTPEEKQHSDFHLMLKLPEEFLKGVFEACKNLKNLRIYECAVRRMLDECGRYYCEVPQEKLKQLREEAAKESLKPGEDMDLKYWIKCWNHMYAFSCDKPDLKECEAQELGKHIYDVCTLLDIDCHILIGQGSVWVFVLVKERLSQEQRVKIAKAFEEFVQSRKETQLSWMFAGQPEERSPFFLPSGLRQVLDFIRLMVGDKLRSPLILNVRHIRPLVLERLRRRNEHVEPWQLRMVSGSRDLCDDDWLRDTSCLRILVCEDWTQCEDKALKHRLLEMASHLPKSRKECALVERKTCAPLAYLCKALNDLHRMDSCTLLPGFATAKSKMTCTMFHFWDCSGLVLAVL